MPHLGPDDYQIGFICALYKELVAVRAMLDQTHAKLPLQDPRDNNSYVLGRIHEHNMAIACMEEGVDGLVPAANVARDMTRTFPALRIGLLVGIGGGIPNLSKGVDIRLGDVVVSTPNDSFGRIIQYDKGKAEEGGWFKKTGQLNKPSTLLLRTVPRMRSDDDFEPGKLSQHIEEALRRYPNLRGRGYVFPNDVDVLHCKFCGQNVDHRNAECQELHTERPPRNNKSPVVHYGIIASGNQVTKDATVRDRLRDEFDASM